MTYDTFPIVKNAPKKGEPVWELATLHPFQGEWHESEYLALETNRLIEFDNGYLEILPMPTRAHQRIVLFLYRIFWTFLEASNIGGEILVAPLPVKLWQNKYREPDLVYLSAKRTKQGGKYPEGADFVIEVVSGKAEDRTRDLVDKRKEYSQAGIPEYWIVDPEKKKITVLTLREASYTVHGEFEPGQKASSVLLEPFSADVTAVFAAAETPEPDNET